MCKYVWIIVGTQYCVLIKTGLDRITQNKQQTKQTEGLRQDEMTERYAREVMCQ